MKARVTTPLLSLSLALNCILLALAAKVSLHQAHPVRPQVPFPSLPVRTPALTAGTAGLKAPPSQSLWGRIESDDSRRFIANLRRVGCPEQTIRDILVFRVSRSYRERLLRTQAEGVRQQSWLRDRSQAGWRAESRSRTDLRNALETKLESLFHESFSKLAWTVLGTAEFGRDEFLPFEKRAQIRDVNARFADLAWELNSGPNAVYGTGDPELQAKRRELERQKQDALAQILVPAELEEYLMRESSAAEYVRRNLPPAKDEPEFRTMVKVALEFGLNPDGSLSAATPPNQDPVATNAPPDFKAQFQQRLKEVLGDERIAAQQQEQQAQQAADGVRQQQEEMKDMHDRLVSITDSIGLDRADANRFMDHFVEVLPGLKEKFDHIEDSLTGTDEEKTQQRVAAAKAALEQIAVEALGERGRSFSEKLAQELESRGELK